MLSSPGQDTLEGPWAPRSSPAKVSRGAAGSSEPATLPASVFRVHLGWLYRFPCHFLVIVEVMVISAAARQRDRLLRLTPFRTFVLAGLLGMAAIAGASAFASRRAGESEAMSDVRMLTQVVAKTVVEPHLSDALLSGDSAAIADLHEVVTGRVLDDTTVRVKLWDASGRIVYSDELLLIGEQYELGEDKNDSLWSGNVVSEISSVEGPENRFETSYGELLEVYLPIDGPDGRPLLYESYFAVSAVADSAARIRAEFIPIIIAALVLLETMHLGLAWRYSSSMRRNQHEREQLLQRAIESSDLERRRIAADLHDGVVQDLVATSFAVSAAAESAGAGPTEHHEPDLADDLRTAAIGTRRSLQSLRSLLVEIYPPNLHEQGIEAALVDLLAPASGLGIETDLLITGSPDTSPEAVTLVYRVAQEAVRNVLRHAEATTLKVTVDTTADKITVTVADNGRGFSPALGAGNGHLGLRLMSDLTADAGAAFSLESTPGRGTTVQLEVPT